MEYINSFKANQQQQILHVQGGKNWARMHTTPTLRWLLPIPRMILSKLRPHVRVLLTRDRQTVTKTWPSWQM